MRIPLLSRLMESISLHLTVKYLPLKREGICCTEESCFTGIQFHPLLNKHTKSIYEEKIAFFPLFTEDLEV